MIFREKLTNASDIELEFYLKGYREFNCIGMKCQKCIFWDEIGNCRFVLANREYSRRKTKEKTK